jgi:hydrogenase assembly chaperone HypC/HupF
MCLGIPARLVALGVGHPDVATADMAGARRNINIGLLDEAEPVGEGAWVLVHMGFALQVITAQEAEDAIAALGAERAAERAILGEESPP